MTRPDDLKELLDADPVGTLAWFHTVRPDPPPMHWHGLAESAAARSHRNATATRDDAARLAWAALSVAVYDWLCTKTGSDSFTLSALNVRVNMILEFGAKPGDPVRDLAGLFDLVRTGLTFAPEEAAAAAAAFKDDCRAGSKTALEAPDRLNVIRRLRRAKNHLARLAGLGGVVELPPDLAAWMPFRRNLP